MAPPSGLYLSRRTQTGSVHCPPIVAQMHHFFWRARGCVFGSPASFIRAPAYALSKFWLLPVNACAARAKATPRGLIFCTVRSQQAIFFIFRVPNEKFSFVTSRHHAFNAH